MLKRINKKAQQEIGIGTMLMLIFGLVALVVVIVGFTAGWDFLTKWFTDVKPKMTVIEKTCNGYIIIGGNGYCINAVDYGKNSYINCAYAKELGAKFDEPEKAPACDPNAAQQICRGLKLEEGDDFNADKTKVNGMSCASLLGGA